jgi:hypothetical protein
MGEGRREKWPKQCTHMWINELKKGKKNKISNIWYMIEKAEYFNQINKMYFLFLTLIV